eukprot:NODE_121_length_18880_cov_0.205687.p13 type:complete len:107 gc:universal NODE_121_length_18880_cov_0.205687:1721-1401(-)
MITNNSFIIFRNFQSIWHELFVVTSFFFCFSTSVVVVVWPTIVFCSKINPFYRYILIIAMHCVCRIFFTKIVVLVLQVLVGWHIIRHFNLRNHNQLVIPVFNHIYA